ncbi:peptidoglycan DD-metalloendopeptidase family protein [Acetobacterium tundrae]|uniref:peptidoglycan DD-metalloendopeptidase family protein n=1 Tax=Acetobacterium tundrae TaxID=132932 RepID=UPI001FACD0BA|nr:peptidoglycan DD-metalloendopeptidase family protein [Acetobacterium tundrae]
MGSSSGDVLKQIGANFASIGSIGSGTYTGAGGLMWPTDANDITSYFGYRDAGDTNGIGSTYHEGVDIGASEGSPVYAAGSGIVTLAGENGGYGNMVEIDMGNGLATWYGHLSSILTQAGASVNAGDLIGLVGSTGNSTGPHLHFSTLVNAVQVDPGSMYGFSVGTRYLPTDMPIMAHEGEMIVPKSENPYANSGGTILPFPSITETNDDGYSTNDIKKSGSNVVKLFKDGVTDMKDPVTVTITEFTDNVIKIFKDTLDAAKLTTGSTGSDANWQNGDVTSWIKQAMDITGVTGDDNYEHLMEIAQNESGGDPSAINDWDSNAMAGTPSIGLMQTIQSTFDAYAKDGMNDIYNPVDNAVAAINYMIDRYGSVMNTGTHGYATGTSSAPAGLAWVGEKGPELMNFRGGENVVNTDESAKIVDLQAARAKRANAYASTAADSTNSDSGDQPSFEINLGGINITIEGSSTGSTDEVIAALQEKMPGIANELCVEIARQLKQLYEGMPTKVEVA